MPYKLELTWMHNLKRWRKRYRGKTYYLKTSANGKKDRDAYSQAIREWERLKAFIDGIGANPYTVTGVLIPEGLNGVRQFSSNADISSKERNSAAVHLLEYPVTDNPFIIGTGLHPELILKSKTHTPYSAEDRSFQRLADTWLTRRKQHAERGELSLKQWDQDSIKLKSFRDFINVNFPALESIDEIDASILNLYREKQWEFVGHSDPDYCIGKSTLKKRLDTVVKWFNWLIDQNILKVVPKDLRNYGKLKLDKPTLLFWLPDEIKHLTNLATDRTKLYVMLGLNLGYTQKDIATLTQEMIDWETGIVTRERQKTGVMTKNKLWPSTLNLLRSHCNPNRNGPVLVDQNGNALHTEKVNRNNKLIVNDTIRLAFDRLKNSEKAGYSKDKRSFKHMRKSAANEIEKSRADLTGLFLAHAEYRTKRFYVEQFYDELFVEVAKLEQTFGFA